MTESLVNLSNTPCAIQFLQKALTFTHTKKEGPYIAAVNYQSCFFYLINETLFKLNPSSGVLAIYELLQRHSEEGRDILVKRVTNKGVHDIKQQNWKLPFVGGGVVGQCHASD